MVIARPQARKQFETMTEQTRELTALGQKVATSSAEPMTRGFGEAQPQLGKWQALAVRAAPSLRRGALPPTTLR